MTWTALSLGALAICGVAWLLTAATLMLGLLGRLRARAKRNVSAQRPQLFAGFGAVTGIILAQVAEVAAWPRALRKGIDVLDILLALALIVTVIAGWSSQRAARGQ
ncbi:MAG TPA: hypothetical protein VMA32_16150 [Streptosporangiaceae bacterium]|nr:hypothetical protein [Streptosporangiaceae bacterium]